MMCMYSNPPLTKEAAHGVCNEHRGLRKRGNDMCQVIIGLSISVRTSRLVAAGSVASEADGKAMMTMFGKPWQKILLHITLQYESCTCMWHEGKRGATQAEHLIVQKECDRLNLASKVGRQECKRMPSPHTHQCRHGSV